ncbi:hypothetical protein ABZW11_38300 [Nonomuraea sp. NPDC004580]|uniref:hypothetical protein n=1 Tax=Nonomuraea sp. NPDC004580 TaxID=3154552 RepID=UPI0033AA5262
MSDVLCGSPDTVLVVIRGNSGSGESTVAHALRQTDARRGLAVVVVGPESSLEETVRGILVTSRLSPDQGI